MDRQSTKISRLNWGKIGLIFILAYFSQIYPYAHFHHSHDEQGLPFEISQHSVDVNQNALADHHEDGHHHHTFDQSVDFWQRVRSCARNASLPVNTLSVCGEVIDGPDTGPRAISRVYEADSLLESLYEHSFVNRGPPTLT